MIDRSSTGLSRAVVVGIDGSQRSLGAALWAVDEADSLDIPLRLVYVVEPRSGPSQREYAAHDLAAAEIATQGAVVAVQSCDRPVKIEVEILQGTPSDILIEQSHSAAMVCLGSLGRHHAIDHRGTSTVAALSRFARCPVTIVRGHQPATAPPRDIVIELDHSTESNEVLEQGMQLARLRGGRAHVITALAPTRSSGHYAGVLDPSHTAQARLDRQVAVCRARHPDLNIVATVFPGSFVNYLAQHADSIQIAVVSRHRRSGVSELVGPPAPVSLLETNCTVVVCGSRGGL